jgi:hypothetical protein
MLRNYPLLYSKRGFTIQEAQCSNVTDMLELQENQETPIRRYCNSLHLLQKSLGRLEPKQGYRSGKWAQLNGGSEES